MKMEIKTVLYGKNGVPFTLIKVVNTPLEQILAIGEREKSRKRFRETIERKTSFVKELEIRKRIEQEIQKLEENFGNGTPEQYSNLSEGQ